MSVQMALEDLIGKYDRPGPRYTSYPTANLFHKEVGQETFETYLRNRDPQKGPLSLYAHLPFCKSLCWYCGCHMKVSRNRALMDEHIVHLFDEIDRVAEMMQGRHQAAQVHLGGGTPNYIRPEQLIALLGKFRKAFDILPDAEISMEVDPRILDKQMVAAAAEAGINRVSIGVQDFNPDVQRAINRANSYELVKKATEWFREAGIEAVNMDLIYGLPLQTPESFQETLKQVLTLEPNRVALFNFAYLPTLKPAMKLIKPKDLPEAKSKFQMLTQSVDQFEAEGYCFIGIDHFARPDDPLAEAWRNDALARNFQGYAIHADLEMLGFGMSAISMTDDLYVQNETKITDWEGRVKQGDLPVLRGYELTQADRDTRTIINRLMCQYTIDAEWISDLIGQDFDAAYPDVREQLEDMVLDGALEKDGTVWRATRLGRFLLRNMAMLFDAHLNNDTRTRFSRTI